MPSEIKQPADIHGRMKVLLQVLNKSQTSFAEKLGRSPSIFSNIIAGKNKPSFDILERMGEVFPAINFPWLINGQGEPLRQPTPTQTANVGNTIGAMHGGTVHYTAEQCVQELAACQARVQELESVAADKQLIIDLLQKKNA